MSVEAHGFVERGLDKRYIRVRGDVSASILSRTLKLLECNAHATSTGTSAQDLVSALDLSFAEVDFDLRQLQKANLVEVVDNGRWIITVAMLSYVRPTPQRARP